MQLRCFLYYLLLQLHRVPFQKKATIKKNVIAQNGAISKLKIERMNRDHYKKILIEYIPEPAVELVFQLVIKHVVFLAIARERKTKHGDFTPAANGKQSRITVNYNLNKYAFLITFLHELAHQITWNKFKNRVKPHGLEWKHEFAGLLQPFIHNGSFPKEIAAELDKDSKTFLFSTVADTRLFRQLRKYDDNNGFVLLETIADQSLFMLPDGNKYKKLKKRRKNYLCASVHNQRIYIFNPLAEVIPIDPD